MLEQGWDSHVVVVDDTWIERGPRRPDAEAGLRLEASLLPWLGPLLPLGLPLPRIVGESPLVVRHRMIEGAQLGEPTREVGAVMGEFLRQLHEIPVEDAVARGLPQEDREAFLTDFAERVVPLLPADRRADGLALLDAVRAMPSDSVVHGDLGPEHILVDDAGVVGVIDWSDAQVGDPALDLAWLLHRTPPECAEAFAAVYGVSPELRERSARWDQLGPWFEVTHGLDTDEPEYVESGLAGVLDRLQVSGPHSP